MDNILDAEKAWDKFRSDMCATSSRASRYVRINPDIGRRPPCLDEVSEIGHLIREVRASMKTPESRAQIARTMHILVASSFYFELLNGPVPNDDGTFSCEGTLSSRTTK